MKIISERKRLAITTQEKENLTSLRAKAQQTYMSADCGSDIEDVTEDLYKAIDALVNLAVVSNC